jgi:hypothetical protein
VVMVGAVGAHVGGLLCRVTREVALLDLRGGT